MFYCSKPYNVPFCCCKCLWTLCSQLCMAFTHILSTHLHILILKFVSVYASFLTRLYLSLFWCTLFLFLITLWALCEKCLFQKRYPCINTKSVHKCPHRVPRVYASHGSGAGNDPSGLRSPRPGRDPRSTRRGAAHSDVAHRGRDDG